MAAAKKSLFQPKRVYIDQRVVDLAYTQEILSRLGSVEQKLITDLASFEVSSDLCWSDKGLLLTSHDEGPVMDCATLTEEHGRPTYALNLIANCPLACSYCILQSVVAGPPLVTVYTNLDEVLEKVEDELDRVPRGSVVSTGQLSDSLAMEGLTQLNRRLIPFFARQDRVLLELKTKCSDVASLLKLKHNGQTVVSWAMAPEPVHIKEETGTAPIPERIAAMAACQQAGYSIGLHFDPVIHHIHWEKGYKKLIEQIFATIDPKALAWLSIGTLRFPVTQVKLMRQRFPQNRWIFKNLDSSNRHSMQYPERLQGVMEQRMREYLSPYIAEEKIYRSRQADQLAATALRQDP